MSAAGGAGVREVVRAPQIRAALLGTLVIMLGFGILYPILPLYARSFGVGYDAVGALASSFAFTRLVFDLVAARAVERYGERRTAAAGAAVVGASTVLAALAPTFPLLVAFRGAGGAGSALFFAAMLSHLLKAAPRGQVGRVMGVYYGVFNVGFVLGPPVGGFLAATLGLVSPFWVYAGACFVAAGVFSRSLRDLGSRGRDPARPPVGRRLRWDRSLVAAMAAGGAESWIISGVYSTLVPLFGRERVGLGEVGVSVGIAVASATELLALYPAGAVADRLGRKHVVVPSFAATVALLSAFGLATTPAGFMGALALLGVVTGAGGVGPSAMLSDLTTEETSGRASGVFRFVADLGFVLGPLSAGTAARAFGLGPAFVVVGAPVAVALALVLSVSDTSVAGRLRRREEAGL